MKAQIVSFHCVLKDRMGKVISSTFNQDVMTSDGDRGDQLIGLANGLKDLKMGEKRRIAVTAAEAYGFYDPDKVIQVPAEDVPQAKTRSGRQKPLMFNFNGEDRLFRVVDMKQGYVTLDGNHPLAGQDLVFEIETTAVRDATPDEIRESKSELTETLH